MRERRKNRRIPMKGEVWLWSPKNEKDTMWKAECKNCSTGGALVFVADNGDIPSPSEYKNFDLRVTKGPLKGINAKVDCHNIIAANGGHNLCMEWIDLSKDALRQITKQLSPVRSLSTSDST